LLRFKIAHPSKSINDLYQGQRPNSTVDLIDSVAIVMQHSWPPLDLLVVSSHPPKGDVGQISFT
jgi:hypothetical protein